MSMIMTNDEIIALFQADADDTHDMISKLSEEQAKWMLEFILDNDKHTWQLSVKLPK